MKLLAKILSAALIVMPFSALAAYNVGLGVDASVGASGNASSSSSAGADVHVGVGANGSTTVETPSGVEVTVDRSGAGGATVTHTNNAELQTYVETVAMAHPMVKSVDVDADGSVDVAYQHRGWFFGFIPVTVTSHTTAVAATDGSVTTHVRMPWWTIFVSGVSKIRTDAEAALNADASVKADATAQTDTTTRMRLADAFISAIAKADAAVRASYDVKAGTK